MAEDYGRTCAGDLAGQTFFLIFTVSEVLSEWEFCSNVSIRFDNRRERIIKIKTEKQKIDWSLCTWLLRQVSFIRLNGTTHT
jgi:hypothetical protein